MTTASIGYLKENVADSTTFRTWVGAANNAEAKAHIYETAEMGPAMPFALITGLDGGFRADRIGMGAGDSYLWEGGVALWFDALATSTDDRDAMAAFMAIVQPIIEEVLALSGLAGYLAIEGIDSDGAAFAEVDRKDADGKKTVQIKVMVRWK